MFVLIRVSSRSVVPCSRIIDILIINIIIVWIRTKNLSFVYTAAISRPRLDVINHVIDSTDACCLSDRLRYMIRPNMAGTRRRAAGARRPKVSPQLEVACRLRLIDGSVSGRTRRSMRTLDRRHRRHDVWTRGVNGYTGWSAVLLSSFCSSLDVDRRRAVHPAAPCRSRSEWITTADRQLYIYKRIYIYIYIRMF